MNDSANFFVYKQWTNCLIWHLKKGEVTVWWRLTRQDANLIDVSQTWEGEPKSRLNSSRQTKGVCIIKKSFRWVDVDVNCSSFAFGVKEGSTYNEIQFPVDSHQVFKKE